MPIALILKRNRVSVLLLTIATMLPYQLLAQSPDAAPPSQTNQSVPVQHFNLNDYAKIGGPVSAPVGVSTPNPETPPQVSEESRKKHGKKLVTGTYLMAINDHGTVDFVKTVHGVGLGLDEKAMEAIRQWRFQPAMKNGHPIASQAYVEVNFKLY